MTGLIVILYTFLGTILGALFCLIPSLHIYNVAGIAVVLWLQIRSSVPYDAIAPFFMAMMVAYSFINTIPMTFFAAADESAGASVLPSIDLLKNGRGFDATLQTGLGVYAGCLLLILMTPFFYFIWTYVAVILAPHLHWVLGLVMVFYVMSEWPKGAGRGPTPWAKFKDSWRNVFAGLVTFTLSALVGLILTTKPLTPPEFSFQNIMPIFLGFFAFPSIVQAYVSKMKIPLTQYRSDYVNARWSDFGAAALPGVIGGLLAAYLPAVTAGIAAVFASHMTNHRNLQPVSFEKPREPDTVVRLVTPEIYYQQERIFLIGGGITKVLYYVGAFLLLFVLTDLTPRGMGRGGLNVLLKPVFSPEHGDYPIMIFTILLSGSLSLLLLISLTDLTLKILRFVNLNLLYGVVTIVLLGIVYFIGGGLVGLGIAAVTTCIGCIPVFYNCRRSHCMAVLLVPIALNMAGYGEAIARFLRLV
ncbi:MAG: hypothetical protein D6679_07330 [Candidatus Hydrogenedentota bacterium]|nr:MAG: hypothetical protein D6679_07330 [Candidatus Hydrogenedentota bacterium]